MSRRIIISLLLLILFIQVINVGIVSGESEESYRRALDALAQSCRQDGIYCNQTDYDKMDSKELEKYIGCCWRWDGNLSKYNASSRTNNSEVESKLDYMLKLEIIIGILFILLVIAIIYVIILKKRK